MEFFTTKTLINFLTEYKNIAYIILFMGSLFETIIGFSFFVYGEIFFFAGSILAGIGVLNIWYVIITLYTAGILGDSLSYYLGYKYGVSIFVKLKRVKILKKYINDQNYEKGIKFFNEKGAKSIFFARLIGPLSWITPFISGIYRINYKTFLKYNIPGVIVGIGQFIIVGYFFGGNIESLLKLVYTHKYLLIFILIIFIISYFFMKKANILNKIIKKMSTNKIKTTVFLLKHLLLFVIISSLLYVVFKPIFGK